MHVRVFFSIAVFLFFFISNLVNVETFFPTMAQWLGLAIEGIEVSRRDQLLQVLLTSLPLKTKRQILWETFAELFKKNI